MSTQVPLVSTSGIWYGYFEPQTHAGDGDLHRLELSAPEKFGNETLFSDAPSGVALTHRSVVNVDVHASCDHEVAIERALAVQVDKSGALLDRGQSIFITGQGNSAYQGILEAGHIVRATVSAPGDQIAIKDGYISVLAQPI